MQMEGISCNICCLEFDDVTVIPRILSCGHSFCSPCLRKLINTKPACPNCRQPIRGAGIDYALNFSLIELVKSINFKIKEKKVTKRIQEVKKKFTAKQETLLKDLEEVRKALTLIETGSIEENVEGVNEAIADLEAAYGELGNRTDYSNLKAGVCLDFDDFESPKKYLIMIHKLLRGGNKLYAIAEVQDGIRYGRISIKGYKVFVHALVLTELPGGRTVLFDDLKKCFVNNTKPRAFLKIRCREKGIKNLLYIHFFGSPSDRFLELCTGEFGPSYKGCFFSIGGTFDEPALHMNVDFLMENIKYGDNFKLSNISSKPNEFLLENFSSGNFDIIYHRDDVSCNTIGKVTSSTDISFLKEMKIGNGWKIVDCGFVFH